MDHPVSISYLDQQSARAAAALPAAGAWDAAPLELACPGFKRVTLYFHYTRGGAAGAFNFRIDTSPDSAGAVWNQSSQYAPGALAAGADTTSAVQRENITYTATGAAIEDFVYGPVDLNATVERIRIPAREIGNVGAPGTLEIEARFA